MLPTDEEIRNAKNYLLLRMNAERLAVSTLDSALMSAARRIVRISRRYNIPPEEFRFSVNPALHAEIREVLTLLREALYNRIEAIDTFPDDGDEKNPFIAPALTAQDNGRTFRQRLAEYISRWGYEIEAVIAAAGLSGVTDSNKIVERIGEYLDNPYENPWMKEHMGEGEAVRLAAIPHYGRGKAIASHTALSILVTNTVAQGWMENWHRLNINKRGFYVMRGSSYPCQICDDQTGFLHDMSDIYGMPPFHPNCCCYVVYTDQI